MEVLDYQQLYEIVDGTLKVKCMKVLLRQGESLFSGRSMRRTSSTDEILESLEDIKSIPAEAYQPEYWSKLP